MGRLYMLVVLAAWTSLAFVYRVAEKKNADRMWLVAAMGLVVAAFNGIFCLVAGVNPLDAAPSQYVLGAAQGMNVVLGLPVFLAAVRRGDLSITWTVLTLSFALASLLALVYPGEELSVAGTAGMLAAAAAVVLLGADAVGKNRAGTPSRPGKGWGGFMALAFLSNTFGMYSYVLARHFAPGPGLEHREAFLITSGLVMCLTAAAAGLASKGRKGGRAAGIETGLLAGVLVFTGGIMTFMTLSGGKVPAHVFFPVTTGGSNVLVVGLSVLFLGERPGRFGWAGITAGMAALLMLGAAAG